MKDDIRQQDFDDLSAWLDGRLDDRRAEEMRRVVESDRDLREACRQLRRLNELLDAYEAPPAPAGLAERIVANVRRAGRRSAPVRLLRWLAPAAAAAAVIIAVALAWNRRRTVPEPKGTPQVAGQMLTRTVAPKPTVKASFFADFEILENFETLQAIEDLETERPRPHLNHD